MSISKQKSINEICVLKCRQIDINKRGTNHLVFNYWGQIERLRDTHIWYNSKLEYIKPKSFINNKNIKIKKNNCFIM